MVAERNTPLLSFFKERRKRANLEPTMMNIENQVTPHVILDMIVMNRVVNLVALFSFYKRRLMQISSLAADSAASQVLF
jgi:hypothetical protein